MILTDFYGLQHAWYDCIQTVQYRLCVLNNAAVDYCSVPFGYYQLFMVGGRGGTEQFFNWSHLVRWNGIERMVKNGALIAHAPEATGTSCS
jgi:hypothetical protein